MATKTVTTQSGKTIKVELVRNVQDKVAYADGYNLVTGREVVERTSITLLDGNKVIAKGSEIGSLYPSISKTDRQMQEKGAVGRIGDAYLPANIIDQIKSALAELDAQNPKSAEQAEIESAKAAAEAQYDADLPDMMAAQEFDRRMDDPNSDL